MDEKASLVSLSLSFSTLNDVYVGPVVAEICPSGGAPRNCIGRKSFSN